MGYLSTHSTQNHPELHSQDLQGLTLHSMSLAGRDLVSDLSEFSGQFGLKIWMN